MVNALLYVAENGCKWHGLPKEFGKWHTVYVRFRRWTENGVIYRIFEALQTELLLKVDVCRIVFRQQLYQGSSRWNRRSKKNGKQSIGKTRGGKTRSST